MGLHKKWTLVNEIQNHYGPDTDYDYPKNPKKDWSAVQVENGAQLVMHFIKKDHSDYKDEFKNYIEESLVNDQGEIEEIPF